MHLMTATAKVQGKRTEKARVFLDLGAQASFISSQLVEAAELKQLGQAEITVQGFGTPAKVLVGPIRQLALIDGEGHRYWLEPSKSPV